VLRDGAAAQYGSDAIAGVINFQLSDRRDGGRIQVTCRPLHTPTSTASRKFTGVAARAQRPAAARPTPRRHRISDHHRPRPQARDGRRDRHRSPASSACRSAPKATQRLGRISGPQSHQPHRLRSAPPISTSRQRRVDPRELTFNRSATATAIPHQGLKLFVNAGLPLGDAAELYAFGSYGHREGQSAAFYRLASDARNVPAIYPNGFLPLINTDRRFRGTVGVRGEVGGFRYDLSASTPATSSTS
jgi:iron complex outermembrane receptor protein